VIYQLSTAFLLGFIGSLHCAAMCGPLICAIGLRGNGSHNQLFARLIYNAGRLTTYSLLGVLFGAIGMTLALTGVQRSISIVAGVSILLGVLIASCFGTSKYLGKFVVFLKRQFASFLQRRGYSASFALGAINGLLPCGLVYAAAAGAAAAGGIVSGAVYMFAFGIGTLPMMLGIGLAGGQALSLFRVRLRGLIPVTITIAALLLILRGMALGIPYVSPSTGDSEGKLKCCPTPHSAQSVSRSAALH
jgi:sulfite exporter TauE/SafE